MRRVKANPPAQRRRAKGSGRGAKRRRTRRFQFRPTRRQVLAASLALAIVSAGGSAYWAWASGAVARTAATIHRGIVAFTVDLGLSVQRVYVEGRHETDRATILAALDVGTGDPILSFDPDQARAQLERLGWVASATVQRHLPDMLFVRIVERKAVAIWQRDGRFVLVDAEGEVIGSNGLERFGHLKVIVGENAPLQTRHLMTVLSGAPEMSERVRAAVWVSDRRWNLRLANGIDISLPEEDPVGAWQRLAALHSDHEILSRDIKAIDLRLPDRLIIRMSEGAKLKTQVKASAKGSET